MILFPSLPSLPSVKILRCLRYKKMAPPICRRRREESRRLTGEVDVADQNDDQLEGRGGDVAPIPALRAFGEVFVRARAEAHVLDLRVIRRRTHVTHDDHDDRGDDRNEDAEVLEVDVIDDPEE